MTNVPFFDLGYFVNQHKLEVMSSLERVVDSGVFIGGAEVERFEKSFADVVRIESCIAVGNGLDAIRMLLEAHGIGHGDEVIVPGFTFYATWLAVMQTGATPIAVDVRLEDACIDPNKISEAISSRTRAILVVHLFGITVDLLSVKSLAKQHGLLVFEDCAQAHFGKTNSGLVGSAVDGAAFSFYPTKNLGALGDAGAVTVNDPAIANRLRSLRSYGVGKSKYEHVDVGWNSRLDPIQAAVLSAFLPGLAEVTEKRKSIGARYRQSISGKLSFLDQLNPEGDNVFHHFVIRSENRQAMQKVLASSGISTDIHYPYFFSSLSPIKNLYSNMRKQLPALPNSSILAEQVISLPMGPWMSNEQVEHVAKVLNTLNA